MSEGGGSKPMALPRRNDEIPNPRDSLLGVQARGTAVVQVCQRSGRCCGGLRGAHPVRNKAEAGGIKSRGH